MREERGNREDEETRQNVPLLESEGQHHRLRQIRLSRWGRDVSTSYELYGRRPRRKTKSFTIVQLLVVTDTSSFLPSIFCNRIFTQEEQPS